jgi:hypothetical protein
MSATASYDEERRLRAISKEFNDVIRCIEEYIKAGGLTWPRLDAPEYVKLCREAEQIWLQLSSQPWPYCRM